MFHNVHLNSALLGNSAFFEWPTTHSSDSSHSALHGQATRSGLCSRGMKCRAASEVEHSLEAHGLSAAPGSLVSCGFCRHFAALSGFPQLWYRLTMLAPASAKLDRSEAGIEDSRCINPS